MKEKKDCKIIQDLLPSYIEKLTTEETNQYIEQHLKECNECKKILDIMGKDIRLNKDKTDIKEVNYFKKYRNKMTFLKSIILMILLIFIIIISRRMIILTTLSEKAEKSKESNNYYVRFSQYEGDTMTIIETYKKDDNQITTSNHYDNKSPENKVKWIEFHNSNKTNVYVEKNDEKIAFLNVEQGGIFPPMLAAYSSVHMENIVGIIKNSILSSIRTVKCNGKECYYFSNLQRSSKIGSEVGYGIYIDKETGLPVRLPGGTYTSNQGIKDTIIEFDYKFNNVTDEEVKEPDITQYRINEE